jgi:hypothetical protein
VRAAISDAYQATYSRRNADGISGHYLPTGSRYTPLSASLICDDPRFIRAAEALLGGPVIPECPEGVLCFFDAGWHNDDGMGVADVRFATYFDVLEADSGGLRFIPESRRREQQPRLCSYRQRWMATDGPDIDGYRVRVTATIPGEVVAFDLHTWHASFGGRDRLVWTITYQRCPETVVQRERTLRSMRDSFEQSCRGFDRSRYPIWRDWLAEGVTHPAAVRSRTGFGPPVSSTSTAPSSAGGVTEVGTAFVTTPTVPADQLLAASRLYAGGVRRIVLAAPE